MSAINRLDEIQVRAKIARQVLTSGTTGAPPNVSGVDVYEAIDILAESIVDVPWLVAALRAVLDLHKAISEEGFDVDVCERCSNTAGVDAAVSWPCLTVRVIENKLKEDR